VKNLQRPFDILAVIPVDSLSGDIFPESVTTQFTADTALLLAPEWHVVVKDIVLIDPNSPGLQSGRHSVTLSLVSGVKARGKPVSSIIGKVDRFLLGMELSD